MFRKYVVDLKNEKVWSGNKSKLKRKENAVKLQPIPVKQVLPSN